MAMKSASAADTEASLHDLSEREIELRLAALLEDAREVGRSAAQAALEAGEDLDGTPRPRPQRRGLLVALRSTLPSARLLDVALALSLWVATGSLALAIADGLGEHPLRRLVVGIALVLSITVGLWQRHKLFAALQARPWLVVLIAGAAGTAVVADGPLNGAYQAVAMTSIGIAAVVARPRTVWLCVLVLCSGYAAALLVDGSPIGLSPATSGHLASAVSALLGYPFAALVILGSISVFHRFIAGADGWLDAMGGTNHALFHELSASSARRRPDLVPTEAVDPPMQSVGDAPRVAERAGGQGRAFTGAELVALSERFYAGVFSGAIIFVALATLTALAFLPLRQSAIDGHPPLITVGAGLLVLVLAGLAFRRSYDVYRVLRRRPRLELVGVLVAALLVSVVSPLRNELWWSACAILMTVALLVPLRRALAYCVIVLGANLAAHVASGDLPQTSTVGIVGLWIGLLFWTSAARVIADRMASHILRLNVARHPQAPRPLQRDGPRSSEQPPSSDDRLSSGAASATARPPDLSEATAPIPGGTIDPSNRLTSRELQVVALLADGYRYGDIAARLSISPGQVHRHVASAVERLRVDSISQLVALLVAEGLVEAPGADRAGVTLATPRDNSAGPTGS